MLSAALSFRSDLSFSACDDIHMSCLLLDCFSGRLQNCGQMGGMTGSWHKACIGRGQCKGQTKKSWKQFLRSKKVTKSVRLQSLCRQRTDSLGFNRKQNRALRAGRRSSNLASVWRPNESGSASRPWTREKAPLKLWASSWRWCLEPPGRPSRHRWGNKRKQSFNSASPWFRNLIWTRDSTLASLLLPWIHAEKKQCLVLSSSMKQPERPKANVDMFTIFSPSCASSFNHHTIINNTHKHTHTLGIQTDLWLTFLLWCCRLFSAFLLVLECPIGASSLQRAADLSGGWKITACYRWWNLTVDTSEWLCWRKKKAVAFDFSVGPVKDLWGSFCVHAQIRLTPTDWSCSLNRAKHHWWD